MNKYNVSKIAVRGVVYDSKSEANRHQDLMLLEKAGKIDALHYHALRFTLGKSDKGRLISYTPDFTYLEDSVLIAEEVKGYRVRDWPVRAAMFKNQFPEWVLRVTTDSESRLRKMRRT